MPSRLVFAALNALSFVASVQATCECGYSVSSVTVANNDSDSEANSYLFTDVIENDFLHVYSLPTYSASGRANVSAFGWQAQSYNVQPATSESPYGRAFETSNVAVNPLSSSWNWGGDGIGGGDPGLQMWVRSKDNLTSISAQAQGVRSSEIATIRNDTLYGSYRIGMKMPMEAGTCAAFFWYHNDTAEIDMEYLSRMANSSSSPINLVLQTSKSALEGFDAATTPFFKSLSLPYVLSNEYHEYRFDWLPDSITYFIDGVAMFTINETNAIPRDPGHLIINHWSNGNAGWSGGPPDQDAVATISYVKAYFNSSSSTRQQNFTSTCRTGGQLCTVMEPDFSSGINPTGSAGNTTGRTPFLTSQPGWNISAQGSGSKAKKSDAPGADGSLHSRIAMTVAALAAMCMTGL